MDPDLTGVVVDAAAERRVAVGTLPTDVALVWGRLPNGTQHPLDGSPQF